MEWVEEVRQTFVSKKEKKRGCHGAGLERVDQGLRPKLRHLKSSAHAEAEAKHVKEKREKKTTTTAAIYA